MLCDSYDFCSCASCDRWNGCTFDANFFSAHIGITWYYLRTPSLPTFALPERFTTARCGDSRGRARRARPSSFPIKDQEHEIVNRAHDRMEELDEDSMNSRNLKPGIAVS